jgi:hypothetical protein
MKKIYLNYFSQDDNNNNNIIDDLRVDSNKLLIFQSKKIIRTFF